MVVSVDPEKEVLSVSYINRNVTILVPIEDNNLNRNINTFIEVVKIIKALEEVVIIGTNVITAVDAVLLIGTGT